MSANQNPFLPVDRPDFTRRAFLRGIGVTMALPWLESVPVFGAAPATASTTAGGTASVYPQRFAALFMGCGVNPDHWWAKGQGAEMQLGRCLEPLEPWKHHLNVIDGLFHKTATGQGIHPAMTGNLLSGVPFKSGAILKSGVSMDQVLANSIGQHTMQASMVLACEQAMTGYHETNFSNAYSSHISWQSEDSPVPIELFPSLAFDSLFENSGSARTISVLDRV